MQYLAYLVILVLKYLSLDNVIFFKIQTLSYMIQTPQTIYIS